MKRSTIYFEDDIHKALRLRSAESSVPVSTLVNEAVRAAMGEEAEDLAAFRERESEGTIDFESFVSKLRKDGKL